jgi:Tol biopolymer transport system component
MLALLALGAAGAEAAVPEGPRLAFVRLTEKSPSLELVTSDASGLGEQVLAGGSLRRARPLPFPLDAPSWSSDGSEIAFSGWAPGAPGLRPGGLRIFVAAADGGTVREVPGTQGGFAPVFAPDGHAIAFARRRRHRNAHAIFASTATWLVDPGTGQSRRLTPLRNGLDIFPTSFSPDGATLAVGRRRGQSDPEVLALRVDGSGSTVLAHNATDAVYSPDGLQIAFVHASGRDRATDLFAANPDGSAPRQLTSTPGKIEIWPSWDPSGRRLVYAQLRDGRSERAILGLGDSVEEINADGTCQATVLASHLLAFYGPTWQPGPGRAAGPIAC